MVTYPEHIFDGKPGDLCCFVEAKGFYEDWKSLGYSEDDLTKLQIEITVNPKGAPVIPKTGGLRKLRWGGLSKGKRGGSRICYAYFESVNVVLLVLAYGKNEQDDIPDAQKALIRDYLGRQERVFLNRVVK